MSIGVTCLQIIRNGIVGAPMYDDGELRAAGQVGPAGAATASAPGAEAPPTAGGDRA